MTMNYSLAWDCLLEKSLLTSIATLNGQLSRHPMSLPTSDLMAAPTDYLGRLWKVADRATVNNSLGGFLASSSSVEFYPPILWQ